MVSPLKIDLTHLPVRLAIALPLPAERIEAGFNAVRIGVIGHRVLLDVQSVSITMAAQASAKQSKM